MMFDFSSLDNADYSLLNNGEEVPSQPSGVLKRAKAKSAGGTLTDAVPNNRPSVLPNSIAALRQRATELFGQGSEMYNKDPDLSQIQELARNRKSQGDSAMLNALAAQFAGEQFQPIQAQYLKRASASREPMKIGQGVITEDGQYVKDPIAAQDKKAEFLMQQAKMYEQMAAQAQTAQEKAAATAAQNETMNQLRLMGLQMQQQGLALRAENGAATRAIAEQNAADRRDRRITDDAQTLSKRTEDFASLYQGVKELNEKLGGYAAAGKTSIPGIGLGSNISLGPLDVSARFIGEEGRINRALAQNIMNQLIRADSGQAVSLQEGERQKLAAMLGSNFTESDFLNAWENIILPRVNAGINNVGAGFTPEARGRYRNQGGKIDFDKPFQSPRGQKESGNAPAGIDPKIWNAMTPEEKALWKN